MYRTLFDWYTCTLTGSVGWTWTRRHPTVYPSRSGTQVGQKLEPGRFACILGLILFLSNCAFVFRYVTKDYIVNASYNFRVAFHGINRWLTNVWNKVGYYLECHKEGKPGDVAGEIDENTLAGHEENIRDGRNYFIKEVWQLDELQLCYLYTRVFFHPISHHLLIYM